MTAALDTGTTAPAPPALERCLETLGCVPIDAIRMVSLWPRGRPDDPESVDGLVERLPSPPQLETLIRRLPTGGWRICRATARALVLLFGTCGPRRVIEFGSGASTVLLAALCADASGDRKVVSLEAEERHAAQTRRLLEQNGLSSYAEVLVAPVCRTRIDDWRGWMYCPDEAALAAAMGGHRAQMVFVDGPANWLGRRGDCRYGTLLMARTWTSDGAVFAADDALRRRDLRIIRRWQHLPFVQLRGILPVGRGIAVGTLQHGTLQHGTPQDGTPQDGTAPGAVG